MIAAFAPRLLASGHVAARALRFGCVGGLSAIVYTAVTVILVREAGIDPVSASVVGYGAALPVSFLGHRGFSFRSSGRWTREAGRFAVAQTLNVALTAVIMRGAVATLGLSYVWGMLGVVLLIPFANFLLMHFWVFPDAHVRARTRR